MKNISLILLILTQIGIDSQTFTNYTINNGLIDNNVLCGVYQGNNVIWFGTQNGISKFDGNTWTNINSSNSPSLIDNTILAIDITSNGELWIGTDFGICKYINASWTCYTESDGLGDNRIKFIKEAPDGKIWIGEYDGLSIFDGSNFTTYNMSDGIPFGGVQHISFESNNNAWLGSGFGGLINFDGSNFTVYNQNNGLLNNRVNGMAIDNQNNKWIGTSTGISVFNSSNNWTNNFTQMYLLPPPDTLNPVMDLEFDSNGLLWAGIYIDYLLNGGVAMYNGNEWIDFNTNDGLIGPVITDLIIDDQNQIWITTSSGVSKLSNVSATVNNIKADDYSIYPNPTNGEFIFSKNNSKELNLKVKDFNGKLIVECNILNKINTISFDVPKGIYIIETSDAENHKTHNKLIKN